MPPKKKSKSKVQEPEPEYEEEEVIVPPPVSTAEEVDAEDEGITRCVCGKADEEFGTWMIQCETCQVWQHGICVGFQSQEDCPETYYCEQCRPDLHVELLQNLRKNAHHHPRNVSSTTGQSTSHDGALHLQTHNLLASVDAAAASTSMSRSSRSPTPIAARSSLPKRRNTLNSREAAYEEALERGDIDALNKITATQDEEAAAANAAKRKRKRSGGMSAADEAARRKRSSPTPGSVTSDRPSALDVDVLRDTNDGTVSVTGSSKADTTARRGKRNKKEKEASLDVDIDDGASNVSASHGGLQPPKKHANQYTYRWKPSPNAVSPTKTPNFNRNTGSAAPEAPVSSAPSRKSGAGTGGSHHKASQQPSAAAPPSPHQPISTPWGLPDHLSHLSDLLPTPLQGPIDVPIGPKDSIQERGAKVKWPQKRTTIGEMRRRVRAMLDYSTKAQVDVTERAKRTASLENFLKRAEEAGLEGVGVAAIGPAKGRSRADAGVDYELVASIANLPEVLDPVLEPSPPISQTTSQQGTLSGSTAMDFSALTTAQLLASLTQDLLSFQERFGAGPGGKVYRETAPRERRPRGAAAAAMAAIERSD
ncbi:hypothetical protein FRB93_005650 [Tulasnella sp. JGI-2019a]|nr:hypothetical protein FRB93_005650 [Tulasnella sp. JGI-2019a]